MIDLLWNTFIAPLPDLAVGTLEIRDVMNLALAFVGVVLAGYAIKMGRDQNDVTAKQMELLKGQKDLLEDLGRLERKQAEIAEQQWKAEDERAKRRPELRCMVIAHFKDGEVTHYDLFVLNLGNFPCQGFRYQFEVSTEDDVIFEIPGGAEDPDWITALPGHAGPDWMFNVTKGYWNDKVYPGEQAKLGTVVANPSKKPLVYWHLDTDFGEFPTDAPRAQLEWFHDPKARVGSGHKASG